jgi:hypothetical protein
MADDTAPVEEDTAVYFRDLDARPTPRPRTRSALTTILVLAVVAGAGFVAGVEVQQHRGGSGGGGVAAFAGRFGAGTGGGAGAPGGTSTSTGGARFGAVGTAGATPTFGTVRLVDGDVLYVTDSSGNIVKVRTTSSSTITRSDEATVGDVRPGDTVVVQGEAGEDGTIQARQVTDSGPSGASTQSGSGAATAGGGRGGFGGGGFAGPRPGG